ncbi:MAG: SH3 domain-containing protein, partial [Desulfobulbaceae bacterium]|nr:SH3 domain-containing protein [Desulfobulbaceae bacterium]
MKRVLLVLVVVLGMATAAEAGRFVSIDGNRVSMRSGPGEKNAVLWELDRGYPLQVIGSQGKWLKVSDFEGDV